jgi:hypothetical protein
MADKNNGIPKRKYGIDGDFAPVAKKRLKKYLPKMSNVGAKLYLHFLCNVNSESDPSNGSITGYVDKIAGTVRGIRKSLGLAYDTIFEGKKNLSDLGIISYGKKGTIQIPNYKITKDVPEIGTNEGGGVPEIGANKSESVPDIGTKPENGVPENGAPCSRNRNDFVPETGIPLNNPPIDTRITRITRMGKPGDNNLPENRDRLLAQLKAFLYELFPATSWDDFLIRLLRIHDSGHVRAVIEHVYSTSETGKFKNEKALRSYISTILQRSNPEEFEPDLEEIRNERRPCPVCRKTTGEIKNISTDPNNPVLARSCYNPDCELHNSPAILETEPQRGRDA